MKHKHIKKKRDYYYDSRAIEAGRWDNTEGKEYPFQCLRCGAVHPFYSSFYPKKVQEFLKGWCRICGKTAKFENVANQPQDYIDTWKVRLRLLESVYENRNPEPRRK